MTGGCLWAGEARARAPAPAPAVVPETPAAPAAEATSPVPRVKVGTLCLARLALSLDLRLGMFGADCDLSLSGLRLGCCQSPEQAMAEAIAHVSQTNAVLSSPAPANQKARPSLFLWHESLRRLTAMPCSTAARKGLGQGCFQGQGGTVRHGNRCLLRHPSTRLQAAGVKAIAARRCQGGQGQADSAPGSRGRESRAALLFVLSAVCCCGRAVSKAWGLGTGCGVKAAEAGAESVRTGQGQQAVMG